MAIMVDNCPRCGAQKITFTIKEVNFLRLLNNPNSKKIKMYELFCVCHECRRTTIFIAHTHEGIDLDGINWSVFPQNLNQYVKVLRPTSPADLKVLPPPDFLPEKLNDIYLEGSKCLAVGCFNASGTMFRLCLDIVTKEMLPASQEEPNAKIRRSLGLRMKWLFDNQILPEGLRDLADCVKDDGNDGAHDGLLDQVSAEDLREFTFILLERIFTEKAKLEEARKRRELRHQKSGC